MPGSNCCDFVYKYKIPNVKQETNYASGLVCKWTSLRAKLTGIGAVKPVKT